MAKVLSPFIAEHPLLNPLRAPSRRWPAPNSLIVKNGVLGAYTEPTGPPRIPLLVVLQTARPGAHTQSKRVRETTRSP